MSEICRVIPVYNEENVIADVLAEIRRQGDFILIAVDDGSDDQTYKVAKENGAIAIRHRINRGKGAAVKTGIEAAKRCQADVIVTIDGDGQHDPGDLAALVRPIIEDGYDVVLGSRLLDHRGMPFVKVVANKLGNLFTWLFYGIYVSDSQSGFRAFSNYAAAVIDTKADKYEYDSKVIREIKNNRLKFIEVPVKVRYTEYSMGKKQKQGFINGIQTLVRMIWDLLV
jgi:glycosyltransferase involved in cell wall biosynthesis